MDTSKGLCGLSGSYVSKVSDCLKSPARRCWIIFFYSHYAPSINSSFSPFLSVIIAFLVSGLLPTDFPYLFHLPRPCIVAILSTFTLNISSIALFISILLASLETSTSILFCDSLRAAALFGKKRLLDYGIYIFHGLFISSNRTAASFVIRSVLYDNNIICIKIRSPCNTILPVCFWQKV